MKKKKKQENEMKRKNTCLDFFHLQFMSNAGCLAVSSKFKVRQKREMNRNIEH